MTTTPPGWYDDGHGALRWWDGAQWTEHVAQPDPEPSPAPTEAEIVAGGLGAGAQDAAAQADAAAAPGGATAPAGAAGGYEQGGYPQGAGPGQAEYPHGAAYPAEAGYPQGGYAQGGYAQSGYPQGEYAQGAYPGGYAPGYPGAGEGGGAFTAATGPRKSRLWIIWVVAGVALLGIVIAAAVIIPLIVLSLSSGNAAGASPDEQAAVATVELYDDAWQEGDCDSFTAATTEDFRVQSGFAECAAFEEDADAFDDNFDDYDVRITGVETVGDTIEVTTNETYTALVDENGEATDPTSGATVYHYTLVAADGGWAIDDLYYE